MHEVPKTPCEENSSFEKSTDFSLPRPDLRMEYKGSKRKHLKTDVITDSADEDDVPRFTLEAMATLPLLPDDVLLCIMKYLGPVDLHNLSKITERLGHLASDKNLWKNVDFRPHKFTSSDLLKYVHYFKKTTKFLALRGFISEAPEPRWREEVLAPELLKEIRTRCPELETLILDEHFGVAFNLRLELFPMTVRYLSMRGCVITDLDPQRSYFQKMHIRLPFIKVLILSNCNWVSPHDFMAISKCYQLEELRMDGCPQLGECVAYTSLAARFGFHSLKILDLRNTRMGDSDVGCFNRSRNLTHLYLQCPSSDNEVSDGLCGDPTCMDLPFRDDFMDSSDDDEVDNPPPLVTNNNGRRVWFPPPILLMNPVPVSVRQAKKRHQLGSGFLIESRSDPYGAAPSTSHIGGDENGDPNLPQASTSYGTLNIMLNPPGPSYAGRKLDSPRKHASGDSDSSSDENFFSSVSFPTSSPESCEHTWTFEEGAFLPTSQVSCTGSSAGTGSRGKKCRHSSNDRSSTPKSNEPSTSSHSFIAAKSADSLKVKNFVPVGSTSTTPGCTMNDRSSKQDDGDSLCEKLKTTSGPSSACIEVNCNHGTEVPIVPEFKLFDRGQGRGFRGDPLSCNPVDMGARRRFRRLARRCRYTGPHLFRLPHHEPTNESTISDLCIMSFVLKDSETDGAGYVRIISPQLVSARPQLHTLVVKNYKMITDASLTYLLKLGSLCYLDVSGTSVTEIGVLQFKLKRPDVEVISDYKGLPI